MIEYLTINPVLNNNDEEHLFLRKKMLTFAS